MSRRPPPPPESYSSDIGPYRLANRIAVGGMAEVFRALEPRSAGEDRIVVIKRLLPHLAADEECRAMFLAEARLGMGIRHDNVVQVLGQGVDSECPYIVLQYVFGVDLWRLTRWLTRRGQTLGTALALFVGTELLAGLEAVHEAKDDKGQPLGVVHRDVSPSNAFLSVHGDVMLGDLGIALEAVRESHAPPPQGERARGKLGYLAPEQVAGRKADQRADLFSVGVVIGELLLGRPLFAGGSEIAVLLAIRDAKYQPFLDGIPGLPKDVRACLESALSRSPRERPASARELRETLSEHLGEPREALRARLGELTAAALGDSDQARESFDRSALAQTIEEDVGELQMQAPVRPPPRPTPPVPGGDGLRLFDLDTPSAPFGEEYEVHTAAGETLGPFSYARIVQGIATGEIGSADLITKDSEQPRPLLKIPELARHLPPSSRTPTGRGRLEMMAETSEVYSLGGHGIVSILAHLLLERATGLLLCEHEGVRKEIYLHEGAPMFVTSNQPSELLGEHLVAEGVITREELDFALAVMPRFEGRLGDTLNALGLVEPVHLFRHIGLKVREKLMAVFEWSGGRGAFYRGVEPPESGFPIDLDPWEVIDSGIDRRLARGLGEQRLLKHEGVLVRTAPERDLDESALPEDAQLLLTVLQAPRTLEELDTVILDPARLRRLLSLLLAIERISWVG